MKKIRSCFIRQWKDPVWSKVIASFIITFFGLIITDFISSPILNYWTRPILTIEIPKENETINQKVDFKGTYDNASNCEVWTFVYAKDEDLYYYRKANSYPSVKEWIVQDFKVGSQLDSFKHTIGVFIAEGATIDTLNKWRESAFKLKKDCTSSELPYYKIIKQIVVERKNG